MDFPKDTVTYLTSKNLDPSLSVGNIFSTESLIGNVKKMFKSEGDMNSLGTSYSLEELASNQRFRSKPSELFLQMYAAALETVDKESKAAVLSPSLFASSGVVTLTVLSVIPDIMRHYHDIIVAAQKEVLIATNAWETGPAVELVTSAFTELNKRAGETGRKVVIKILMDAITLKNAIHARVPHSPDTWKKIGMPSPEEIPNLEVEIMNYHVAPLGTFHSKFMVADRQIGLINSNNINIRSNVEMMCRVEGDIVNSLYDTFLISWCRSLPNPPGLPCLNTPAEADRDFYFATTHKGNPDQDRTSPASLTDQLKSNEAHYYRQNNPGDSISVNKRLGVNKDAPETCSDHQSDFTPYYFHLKHDQVPMALVNRPPYHLPGHGSLHNPQNAAWLTGLRLAQKEVFIQSPVFNAYPVVDAVLATCKRGVKVTLFVDIGFNDFAEGKVPFQGGTNEEVMQRMMKELVDCKKDEFLRFHWYTAKDQEAPLHFDSSQRNCHVKFMQIDGQVGIMGSGNMDTQSWFHSQEVNVMVDSPQLVAEWKDNFQRNQNTEKLGLIDKSGALVSGKPVPQKTGHGGLSRSQGGFL